MQKIICSTSPHIRANPTTRTIMIDVLIALVPATIAAIVFFGLNAFLMIALSLIGAFLGEILFKLALKKTLKECFSEFDFSTAVSGLLLGLNMPPLSGNHFYIPLLSGIFAVVVLKMLFGGSGFNFINCALGGRVFALISFTVIMTQSYAFPAIAPLAGFKDLATGATPLTAMLTGSAGSGEAFNMGITNLDLFLGAGVAGSVGETCKLALLLGGIYLSIRKVIDFKFPLLYIALTGIVTVMINGFNVSYFLPSILSGGLFLGAIFMATDYVTTPNTTIGNYIFIVALGILTPILRAACGMEVVSFAIILMNLFVPLINKYVYPRPFGFRKSKEAK